MNDPLDLFPEPKPQSQPAPNGGLSSLLVGLLIGVAAILLYQRFVPDRFIPDGGDQEQVEPSVNGHAVVFVHERNPQPIEHDMLLREMPAFCKEHNLSGGFLALDDDLLDEPVPSLIQFAQTRGVSPPFVVLVDKNTTPVKAASWPADLDALKAFIK